MTENRVDTEDHGPAKHSFFAASVGKRVRAAMWHFERSREILRDHPEIRRWIGPDRRTAFLVFSLVALQYSLAWLARDIPWYLALVLAYFVGTVISHALGVAIHECAHDLVFKRRWANKALSIFANMPLMFPAAIDFREKHLRHHRYLGGEGDFQAPSPKEAKLTKDSWWKKFMWLSFGPLVFHGSPPPPGEKKRGVDPWFIANFVATVSTMPVIFYFSPPAFVYLFFSAFLAFGPHPVGIRRYAEHVALAPGQPTYSYYGFWNRFSLNVGYHVEHHDFPGVPWTKVSELKKLAPEHYLGLVRLRSWSRLLWNLFFNRGYAVDRYVDGKVRETNESLAVPPQPSS